MNIFILSEDPFKSAQMMCNKHVVKMLVESAQILCTAAWQHLVPMHYKPTHIKHPCVFWAWSHPANYVWLQFHFDALCREYTFRYKKTHACEKLFYNMSSENLPDNHLYTNNDEFFKAGSKIWKDYLFASYYNHTPFVQCMPEKYKDKDPVTAYRNYYIGEKARFAKWEPRAPEPEWWPR